MIGPDGQDNIPHRDWLLVFDRVMNEIKEEMKNQKREGEFIGARVSPLKFTWFLRSPILCLFKIIYSTIRFISPEELEWYTEDCIALKQEFPHLIAGGYSLACRLPPQRRPPPFFFWPGFDLVGDENVLKPLVDYIQPLLRFQDRQKELGLEIPFIFHAGETLGDGTKADDNLYDAMLLGTKRIGHGYVSI
jgi:adenosine deaminase CECR1